MERRLAQGWKWLLRRIGQEQERRLTPEVREITAIERTALESLHAGGWWNYTDFSIVLKIDEETALHFLFGPFQLLASGAIEELEGMPPGACRYFRFAETPKPN